MNIKSFNEIWKELEGAGSQGNDGEIAALAKKLHAQGIANTMLEAREKARDMLNMDKEMARNLDAKKEKLTNYNDPRNNPNYHYREQKIQEMRKRAMSGGPAPVSPTIPYRAPRSTIEEEHVTQIVDMPTPISRPRVQTIIEDESKALEEKKERTESVQETTRQEEKKPRRENPAVDLGSVFNFYKRE